MTKAIAYLRVSTDKQENGLQVQRGAISRWAAAHGVEIVSEHVDKGVGGRAALSKRDGLMDALVALQRDYVLVVHRRDRLARDVAIVVALENEVKRRGASLAAVEGGANGDGPEAQFMRRILDAVAEFECELIRARTRATKRLLKRKGRKSGPDAPFGWAHEGGRLVANPREQQARAMILSAKAEGATLRETVELLNASGLPPRTGKWMPEKVRRVLLYKPPA